MKPDGGDRIEALLGKVHGFGRDTSAVAGEVGAHAHSLNNLYLSSEGFGFIEGQAFAAQVNAFVQACQEGAADDAKRLAGFGYQVRDTAHDMGMQDELMALDLDNVARGRG